MFANASMTAIPGEYAVIRPVLFTVAIVGELLVYATFAGALSKIDWYLVYVYIAMDEGENVMGFAAVIVTDT